MAWHRVEVHDAVKRRLIPSLFALAKVLNQSGGSKSGSNKCPTFLFIASLVPAVTVGAAQRGKA